MEAAPSGPLHKESPVTLSRRALLKATAATTALGGVIGAPFVARAQSAEFAYKYANNLPVTHPMNVRAREMADALLRLGEEAHAYNEAKLREVARDIRREFGIEEPRA